MQPERFFLSIAFITIAFLNFCASIYAGISPLAFKNVNACFTEKYRYCSPIFGSVALSTGLIENLRFYNVEPGIDSKGHRTYISDKAPSDDPYIDIIKILFPSPAGQLTPVTRAASNFGRYCEPQHIAELINFSHKLRRASKEQIKDSIDKLPAELKNDVNQKLPPSLFKDKGAKKARVEILNKIIQALSEEKKKAASIYPQYFLEQILTAFFCLKFDDQEHIKVFLQNLDNEIVDKTKIKEIKGLWTKEAAKALVHNVEIKNLDHVWIILNQEIFSRILPYKQGSEPISNGLARCYGRPKKEGDLETVKPETFPDCVEVVIRHLINFFLYNSDKHTFDDTFLKQYQQKKIVSFLDNLNKFYGFGGKSLNRSEIQTPDKADAGDIAIRSAWNKVVADLGDQITYKIDSSNEIRSGMFNIGRVLKTLFSFDISASEPIFEKEKDEEFIEQGKKWFAECIEKLCLALNSNLSCDVEFKNISYFDLDGAPEFGGIVTVDVTNTAKVDANFKFSLRIVNGHAEVDSLTITCPQETVIDFSDSQKNDLQEWFLSEENSKTIYSSLARISPSVIASDFSKFSMLYQMFLYPINDTYSKVSSLDQLCDFYKKDEFVYKNFALRIIKNILHDFLWEDVPSVFKLMPILKKHSSIFQDDQIKSSIRGLAPNVESDLLFVNENLNYLFSPKNFELIADGTVSHLKDLPKWTIELLNLNNYTNLKVINLTYCSELKKIQLPSSSMLLEKVRICSVGISDLLSVPNSPRLKTFELGPCGNLKSLEFFGDMKSLKSMKIKSADKLEQVLFHTPQTQLEKIDLSVVAIKNLNDIISQCPNLKKLTLNGCENTKNLTLKGLNNFEELTINNAQIENVILSNVPNIRKIFIQDKQVKNLSFDSEMQNLQELYIMQSDIESLNLSLCPNIKILKIMGSGRLQKIQFALENKHLESIKISNTNLKEIDLHGAEKLNTIHIAFNSKLESIAFPNTLNDLESVFFQFNSNKKLDLPSCPKLENVILALTSCLEEINFKGAMTKLNDIEWPISLKVIRGVNFLPKNIQTKIPKKVTVQAKDDSVSTASALPQPLDDLKHKLRFLASKLRNLSEQLQKLKETLKETMK